MLLVTRRCDPEAAPVHLLRHDRLLVCDIGSDPKTLGMFRRAVALTRAVLRLPIHSGDLVVVRVPEVVSLTVGLVALVKRATLVVNVVAEPDAISAHLPRLAGASRFVYGGLTRLLCPRARGRFDLRHRARAAATDATSTWQTDDDREQRPPRGQ